MTEYLLLFVIAALALASFCLLLLLLKRSHAGADPTQAALLLDMAQLKDANERLERGLRTEVQASAQGTRSELAQTLTLFQQALLAQSGDVARQHEVRLSIWPAASRPSILLAKRSSDERQRSHNERSKCNKRPRERRNAHCEWTHANFAHNCWMRHGAKLATCLPGSSLIRRG